jgi:DNA-binding transcriptional regulator YhcF (GntR family)
LLESIKKVKRGFITAAEGGNMEFLQDYIAFNQPYLRDHDDWYVRLQYFEYYAKSLSSVDLRHFSYTFAEKGSLKEMAAKFNVDPKTLRPFYKDCKESFEFQKISGMFLMVPRKYIWQIINIAGKDKTHVSAAAFVKVALFSIGVIYTYGEMITSNESLSKVLNLSKITVTKNLEKLQENGLIKRTIVGNNLRRTGSHYSFA